MFASAMETFKSALGVQTLSDWVMIDERKQGYETTRLEVAFEQAEGQEYARLRVTNWKGNGTTGRFKKSFPLPLANAVRPVELIEYTQRIFAATHASAVRRDPRGIVRRGFESLFGVELINHVENLATTQDSYRAEFSAMIFSDRFGRWATLYHQYPRGRKSFMSVPIASLVALQTWATDMCE